MTETFEVVTMSTYDETLVLDPTSDPAMSSSSTSDSSTSSSNPDSFEESKYIS